jgi:hypothetical protein
VSSEELKVSIIIRSNVFSHSNICDFSIPIDRSFPFDVSAHFQSHDFAVTSKLVPSTFCQSISLIVSAIVLQSGVFSVSTILIRSN